MPVYEYFHNGLSESITGGYVYRSAQSKSLFGMYIFADYVQKFIDGFTLGADATSGVITHLLTAAQNTGNPISFGEDRYGDLYILFGGINTVFKFQDSSHLRKPKAFFTPVAQGDGSYLLQGLQGRNLSYQWLKDNVVIPGGTLPDLLLNAAGTYTLIVTNELGLSDTSSAFSFGALPIALKNFTAVRKSTGTVLIQWQTASEENIKGFYVQRRMNQETAFSTISYVQANGNRRVDNQYLYTDSAASAHTIFYRLQIVNRDGSFNFSDIRIISGNDPKQFLLYPNPVHGQINIFLNDGRPMELNIYDYAGRKVKHQKLMQQTNQISLTGLRGVYFFQLTANDGANTYREKIIIL
jgi:hypothetical protein